LQEAPFKEQLRNVFGNGIFTPEGEVARGRLKSLVFGPGREHTAARTQLEQIVHPRIKEILGRQVALAQARPGVEAVILDAALLLEAGWRVLCDAVVFVDAPFEERLARVTKTRGWSRDEFRFREMSQFPLERKRREAAYVVENTGDGSRTLSQLEDVYSRVLSKSHS